MGRWYGIFGRFGIARFLSLGVYTVCVEELSLTWRFECIGYTQRNVLGIG